MLLLLRFVFRNFDSSLLTSISKFTSSDCDNPIIAPCMKYNCYNGGICEYLPNWPPDFAQCICPDDRDGDHCELSKYDTLFNYVYNVIAL